MSVATQVIHPVSRDQGRACVTYRTARSACSFMYVTQMLLHIQRWSAHIILPILALQGLHQYICTPSLAMSDYLYPVSSLALPRWRRLWFGAYSWPLTGHLHTSFAKSRTCWRKRKEGCAALLHRPYLHECSFITSTISITIPSSFLRPESNRYATCSPRYPDPTLIRRPRIQHESPSVTLAMDSILSYA